MLLFTFFAPVQLRFHTRNSLPTVNIGQRLLVSVVRNTQLAQNVNASIASETGKN